MNILVLANGSCESDERIIRSAEAAAEAGHTVTILARGSTVLPRKQIRRGVTYLRPRGTGSRAGNWIRPRLRKWFGPSAQSMSLNAAQFLALGCKLNPDIIHAHELYTLYAGRLIARQTGARLIYDSHELELGRNGVTLRNERLFRAFAESRLIRQADAVITVSNSIADYLTRRYRIPRPIVVLNAPRSAKSSDVVGSDVRSHLVLPAEVKIIVYVGSVTFNRGLDYLVEAMQFLPAVHVALVGSRPHPHTEKAIVGLANTLGLSERVHFVDPVPADQVTRFISSADASAVLIQDACLSYRYCFPNKLLESVLAGLPVVVSRLPELEKFIQYSGAGVAVDETDSEAIAAGVQAVLSDNSIRLSPQAVAALENEFGWQQQANKLLALYDSLGPRTHAY